MVIVRVWFLLFVSMFCLCVWAGEVNVKKLSKRNWIMLESQNFSVFSDAKEKTAIQMLEELENFNHFMSLLMGYEKRNLETKIPVVLTKNKSSFVSLGMSREFAGVFLSRDGGLIFARADKFRSSEKAGSNWGRAVVLHELVHYLMNSSSLGLASPPWFNEGTAEYFGTFIQKRNSIVIGDMSILKNRFYSLLTPTGTRMESVDSESLFKTRHEDLNISDNLSKAESRFLDKFYARSVSVVHYLNADPKRRTAMYKFLFALNRGVDIDTAFSAFFKMSYNEFDELVDDYINGKYVMARTFPRGEGGIDFPEVVVEKVELSKLEAMRFLYSKISLLSQSFLGAENIENMNADFERLFPDLFE